MDDQNLNGPIQAAHGRTAHGSLEQPVLGFVHQYTTQIKVLMKKIRFLVKIGQSIAVFPF